MRTMLIVILAMFALDIGARLFYLANKEYPRLKTRAHDATDIALAIIVVVTGVKVLW